MALDHLTFPAPTICYHIISITAVFLALGLGLALGTSFGNRALVSSLQTTQRKLDREVKDKRATNSRLEAEASRRRERDERFEQQAVVGPLLARQLDTVPLLLVAPTGIDDTSLNLLRSAITTSGANFAGTLRLDRRLTLDGDNATKLAVILGVPDNTTRPELRRMLVRDFAALLRAGAKPPAGGSTVTTTTTTAPATAPTSTVPGDTAAPTTAGATTAPVTPTTTPEVPTVGEAPLVTRLRDGGFVQFEPPANGDKSDPVALSGNYRYVFASGPGADLPDADLLLPLVRASAATRDVPIVVVSAAVGDDPEAVRTSVVGPIRGDSAVNQAVSTVDNIESFDGIAATILALQEMGQGRQGHYGVGAGATAPLPPVPNRP